MLTRRSVLAMPALALGASQVCEIGDRRELFVDGYLVEELRGAELRLGQAVEAGVALRFDQIWEGRFSNYVTMLMAGEELRAYYRGVPNAGADGRGAEVTCVAVGTKTGELTRPDLSLFPRRGPNVILAGDPPLQHNFSPLRDPRGRYLALAGTSKSGLVAYESGDGFRWKKLREEAVLEGGAFDSQNVAFYSAAEGKYICYYRTFKRIGTTNYRWVSRAVSQDFLNWRIEGEVDFAGAPAEHLYTNQLAPYYRAPHVYVGLCARFLPGRQVLTAAEARQTGVDPGYFKDSSDAVLVSARGGRSVDRKFLEAFLRPGLGLKNWVSRSNYPALNLVPYEGERMAFYVVRDYGQATIHLARYVLRLDGLASVSAGYWGGEVLTRVLRYAGRQLELNFSTSAPGGVRVRVEDERGQTLAESEEMVGDRTAGLVRWKGRTDVGEFAGRAVRLRIELKDADVYALRFGG
ncbi:MAG: hypothetical protein K7J46_09165 [Bryobacter sp.]|jgi:hypothetical protein|nr:hypothetical protein [Bryobacter sp. CoA8 C33]